MVAISNLKKEITEREIFDMFKKFGTILYIVLVKGDGRKFIIIYLTFFVVLTCIVISY